MNFVPSISDLWFLPLGGADEIGMNFNLFGHDGKWIIIDCGVTFHDRFGVEIITPDIRFIQENKIPISAIVVTHAHEDHIGALPYLWPLLKAPIYATPFTAALVRKKLKDQGLHKKAEVHEISLKGKFSIGPFDLEFVTLTHSIPEPNALLVRTPVGNIFHTGDWKFDPDPLVGASSDLSRLSEIGDSGVLALVCDSTNVFCEGQSGSEAQVREELIRLVKQYPSNRITVACFASNIARIQTIIQAAHMNGRRVSLLGRSLHRMFEAAQQCGYLDQDIEIVDDCKISSYPPEEVLLICTGSQGEPRSALARISSGQHRSVKMTDKDVIFFSSRVIPGNEKTIGQMQNRLTRQGVHIVTSQEEEIHVSGHPSRSELRKMYQLIKPQIVVPVHGEARHLYEQARLAREEGVKTVIIPQNGSLIQLAGKNSQPKILEQVHEGRCYWDSKRLRSEHSPAIRDRQKLSVSGCIFISLLISKTAKNLLGTTSSILGISEPGVETDNLVHQLKRIVQRVFQEDARNLNHREDKLKYAVRRFMEDHYGKDPFVQIHFSLV